MVDLLEIRRIVDCLVTYFLIYLFFCYLIELLSLFPKMSCVLSSSVKAKLLSLLVHCYFLIMLSCKQERLSLLFAMSVPYFLEMRGEA